MIFKRKKDRDAQAAPEQPAQDASQATDGEGAESRTAVPGTGPRDISEVDSTDEYLNFGSLLIKPMPGLKVRLDIEETTKRVISLSLEVAESRIQLQAFARAKSQELWPGISARIAEDIGAQKGELFSRDGEHGRELLAKVPQQLPDGRDGHVALRFVGVDGPRWFLRVVIGGAAISNEEASKVVDELVRSVVVDRGSKPLPPQELLPLNVPANATTRAEPQDGPAAGIQRPERGPEITQIG